MPPKLISAPGSNISFPLNPYWHLIWTFPREGIEPSLACAGVLEVGMQASSHSPVSSAQCLACRGQPLSLCQMHKKGKTYHSRGIADRMFTDEGRLRHIQDHGGLWGRWGGICVHLRVVKVQQATRGYLGLRLGAEGQVPLFCTLAHRGEAEFVQLALQHPCKEAAIGLGHGQFDGIQQSGWHGGDAGVIGAAFRILRWHLLPGVGGETGETDEGGHPGPCCLEAPGGQALGTTYPEPPAASEQLRTFLLCSSASNSRGHLLVKNAYFWSLVPSWNGTGEAAKASLIRSSDDSDASVLRTTFLETLLKL